MALLTRLLLDQGAITYEGVEEAIKAQVIYGGRIGTNLVELKIITEAQLCTALERSYGLPSTLLDPGEVEPEALRSIPEKFIREHKVVPFRKKRMAVSLAMVDPSKRRIIADISFSTGLIIKPHVCPEYRLDKALEKYFDIPIPWRYTESYEEDVAPADIQATLDRPIEELTRDEAEARFATAQRGKEIPNTLLGFSKRFFQRSVLFVVKGDWLIGIEGYSPPRRSGFARGYTVSLDEPSLLADVARGGGPYRGPLPDRDVEEDLIFFVGGEKPKSAVIAPIVLRGRVVNVFYGDAGPHRGVSDDIGEFFVMAGQAAQAYDRLVRDRVAKSLKEG